MPPRSPIITTNNVSNPVTTTYATGGATTICFSYTHTFASPTFPAGHGRQITNEEHQRQLREFELRRVEDRRRSRELEEERRTAAALRAQQLLMMFLTTEQQAEYNEHQHFHVRLPNGHVYLLEHEREGNILRVDERPWRRFCIHPPDYLPIQDQLLQQKYMLITDEEGFLRAANMWGVDRRDQPEEEEEAA